MRKRYDNNDDNTIIYVKSVFTTWQVLSLDNLLIFPGYVSRLYFQVIFPGYISRLCFQVIFPGYISRLCFQVMFPGYISRLCFQFIFPGYVSRLYFQVMFHYFSILNRKSILEYKIDFYVKWKFCLNFRFN